MLKETPEAGTNGDALHTCLLCGQGEAPSVVAATERRQECMLKWFFYQHKEQRRSVQVIRQEKITA